jgi:predicted metal-dependent peptidase
MNENSIKYQKMIEDTDSRLKNLMATWVLRYDYFGFLFSLIRRRAVVGLPNPMAVSSTKDGVLELLYNPIIISATADEYVNEGLKHEGLHVLNKHLSRRMRLLADISEEDRGTHSKLINIAADCCVNSQGKIRNPLIIAGVPFKLHFPESQGLKPEKPMEEYYYTLLDRLRKEENQKGQGKNKNSKGDDKSDSQSNQSGGDSDKSDGDSDKSDEKKDQPSSGSGDGENDDPRDDKNGESSQNGNNESPPSGGSGESPSDGKPIPQERGGSGSGQSDGSDLNNHQNWDSDDVIDPHAISRHIDNYTQKIIKDSYKNFQRSKSRGKMPGYLQELIENALKPAPIPYYEIIRQFVRGSRLGKYKRSPTHINRKRMYVFQLSDKVIPVISPFPGRTRDLSFKIGIIIDTSGSQTPDDVIEALSGCADIIEKDRHCDVTVLEVDTKIHKEYQLKKIHDIDFDVKGRGGTTLFPGIARCKDLNVDVCVCFTDGFTENFNEIDRRLFPKKMLWVITPKGSEEKVDRVGFAVRIPERNNE